MELYLLRHAIAEDRTDEAKPDSDRKLTPEGERKMERIADGMKAMEINFDVIVSSPFARAKQTADIVAGTFKLQKSLEISDDLTPQGNPRKLIESLKSNHARDGSVLLVGHEPYLSTLISLLVSGDSGLLIELKKGGLCKLCTGELKYSRCASMEWLLTPRQLRGFV